MKAATSKISSREPASELSTNRANSIEATPFGPNQAMNSFIGAGIRSRRKESITAAGRAISRAATMNSARTQMSRS